MIKLEKKKTTKHYFVEDHNIRNVKYRKNRRGKTGKRCSETYVVLNRWLMSSCLLGLKFGSV